MTAGILAFGAYIPRLRLSRRAIAEANAWFNPALKAQAKGERAICNWDEDAVTMAVEAARDALAERDRGTIAALHFASTSFPFADRLNAGIVVQALNLGTVAALDVAASQRAGSSALIAALRGGGETLVVAADKRRTRSASPLEMSVGDGAAALLVGDDGSYVGGLVLGKPADDPRRAAGSQPEGDGLPPDALLGMRGEHGGVHRAEFVARGIETCTGSKPGKHFRHAVRAASHHGGG